MALLSQILPLLPHVSKPVQYVGAEVNAVHKHWSDMRVKIGLCFPDLYEIGMSHLGLHVLYDIVNTAADVVAERIYAPDTDLELLMKTHRIPLFSLESHRAASEFDILGFTLQYELSYSNILHMLSLADIPLRAQDRAEDAPLIIAGGPCSCNPEPLAEYIDLFVVGDAETALPQLVNLYKTWKENRTTKQEFLKHVCSRPGVYVPSFYAVAYDETGRVREIRPTVKDAPEYIQRRIEPRLDALSAREIPIVPYLKTVHDRLTLEIMRGCSRGCRFCQAGYIYRPTRERSFEQLLCRAKTLLKQTGYDEVSLSSLSSGDYTQISVLLKAMMQTCEVSKVAVALPSMRVDTLTGEMASVISRVRKTGFTVAPEAGTQRLRDVLNKGITEEDILRTAEEAFLAGWDLLKLYFMIGLPTETSEDIEALLTLIHKVKKIGNRIVKKKVKLNVAISSFVPKAHTPFQWEQMDGIDELRRKQDFLKKQIRARTIQLKWHNVQASFLEGVFARGDRRLARVLSEAQRLGCKFDAWNEHFDFSKWMTAFSHTGLDPDFYAYRVRNDNEIFPWEHIQTGVSKAYLWHERLKGMQAEGTPPCTIHCRQCGLCNEDMQVVVSENTTEQTGFSQQTRPSAAVHHQQTFRVRFIYYKTGVLRFLSHLDLGRVLQRALARIEAPLAYSQGFHPHPRIAYGPALPVGTEGYQEYVDVLFTEPINVETFVNRINTALPPGIGVIGAYTVAGKEPSLSKILNWFKFWTFVPQALVQQGYTRSYFGRYLDSFQEKDTYLVNGFKKRSEAVDIKPFISSLQIITGELGLPGIQMVLHGVSNTMIKPAEVLSFVFDIPYKKVLDFRILRVNMGTEESLPLFRVTKL